MNLLVNGASVSRGPNSWPYYLQNLLGCDMVNLAQAGCGNSYIHETTISELARRPYDLVLIMWAECGRMDFRVKDITRFADSKNTSHYQSAQNDWPEKIVYPVNDQDHVEKNWIFSLGYLQGQRQDTVSRVFKPFHDIVGYQQILESEYLRMISLQAVLKAQAIPYVFMHWRPIKLFKRFQYLHSLVDWNQVFQTDCLESIAKQNNWTQDGVHPDARAHESFAQLLCQHIISEIPQSLANKDNPCDSTVGDE